ncbi:MAG: NAD(P)H-dependent oxidoreductase [Dehalococcoidia bacterium]|nr:NAD(P)H-dependent oxidoreductase [Dehalococcoidia bacterium]MDW8119729.1 NAD(P)H-dependent oxidoreductase [Chloroflexota bacterium]
MPITVLILYDGHSTQVVRLAQAVAQGVHTVPGAMPLLRPVAQAQRSDLLTCDALALGCPNWSGIPARLKAWLDEQGDLWEEGSLAGKPGAAFVAGRGRHSGLEFTLLALLHWMLACGMLVVGLPWTKEMERSGSYYGATAAGYATEEDLAQARRLGQRLATIALRLHNPQGETHAPGR